MVYCHLKKQVNKNCCTVFEITVLWHANNSRIGVQVPATTVELTTLARLPAQFLLHNSGDVGQITANLAHSLTQS